MALLRKVSTLRLVEDALFHEVDKIPIRECVVIDVDHDLKRARMDSTMYNYYEQRVVIPRIEQTLRDLYPEYDINVYKH
jgi:hypothetical protein